MKRNAIMRWVMLCGGGILLSGVLLWGLRDCGGHNPNHDIDREKAQAAAYRVHATPPPGVKHERGHGG